MALLLSMLLAGFTTWSFLQTGDEGTADPARSAVEVDTLGRGASAEPVMDEAPVVEAPVEPAADVTFSTAKEAARFSDGSWLEQDDVHRLTLRDPGGEKRWTFDMEGVLLGAHQVDADDDGTLEWLLVDQTQAVGLDAQGQAIPGFSIRPGSAITTHAVVDYDGNGQERYLLGLADGRILNHRRLGEATPGWYHVSKGQAVQAIAHLRAGRNDYLCTVDEQGRVMLLKRSGQRRIPTPAQLRALSGPRPVAFEVKSEIGACMLVSRNAEGQVEVRRFDDGIARPASGAEVQLLEATEAKWWPRPDASQS